MIRDLGWKLIRLRSAHSYHLNPTQVSLQHYFEEVMKPLHKASAAEGMIELVMFLNVDTVCLHFIQFYIMLKNKNTFLGSYLFFLLNEDVDEDWRALFKKYIAPHLN